MYKRQISIHSSAYSKIFLAFLSIWLLPTLIGAIQDVRYKQSDVTWRLHLKNFRFTFWRSIVSIFVEIVFVPFEAFNNVDAACRALARLFITRKKLLEWTTFTAAAQAFAGNQLFRMFRQLWFGSLVGLLAMFLVGEHLIPWTSLAASGATAHVVSPDSPVPCGPETRGVIFMVRSLINWAFTVALVFAWTLSPIFAWYISAPLQSESEEQAKLNKALSPDQRQFLLRVARQQWR